MGWPKFLRFLVGCAMAIAAALYVFIVTLDPYQNVPFSPPLARAPVSTNQRFAYPAVARNPRFDALILGTSTTRLLDPARLGDQLAAGFANLSMNSATAYEQARMHELFVRHHATMRYFVLGIDETWCNRADHADRYTFREFPEWMYDEHRYNDLLYLFNDKALENAVRMLEFLGGRREAKYRNDGYSDFTLNFSPREAGEVKRRLYGDNPAFSATAPVLPSNDRPGWRYPLLDLLFEMLARTPQETKIVLLFPALHARYVSSKAEVFGECKGRIASRSEGLPQVSALDYLYASDLTRHDANYWDRLHFTSNVARLIEADIIAVLSGQGPQSPFARTFVSAPVQTH